MKHFLELPFLSFRTYQRACFFIYKINVNRLLFPVVGGVQLDTIQRAQRLLEARVHDLHNECKMNEESRGDDVKHVRLILTETQKALGSVVSSMASSE